jgi:hypothetical protein
MGLGGDGFLAIVGDICVFGSHEVGDTDGATDGR